MPVYIGKSGDLVGCFRCLTHSQTTEYKATQRVYSIKLKLSHTIFTWRAASAEGPHPGAQADMAWGKRGRSSVSIHNLLLFCFFLSVSFFTTSCSCSCRLLNKLFLFLVASSPITTFFCFFLLISYFTTSSLSLPRFFLPGQPPTSSSPPAPINMKSQIFWLCPVWKIFIIDLKSCHIFIKVVTWAPFIATITSSVHYNVCRILNAMLIEFNTEGYWSSKNSSSQGRNKVMENWEYSYLWKWYNCWEKKPII